MSDLMRPIPFAQLMDWVLSEYQSQGSVFGVNKLVSYAQDSQLHLFGEGLEAPFGPAAGPHTQLAQNIIAAYVGGARFFELKTVQIMDGEELAKCVAKPCITAHDECYNCEWSTELYVPQAFEEYVKGWYACKLLAKELGLGDPNGFIFNLSVGYDLAGIQSPKIDSFIEGMKHAADTDIWKACQTWTLDNLSRFSQVDADYVQAISPQISRSITESTLHGCPPAEIEAIASYLLTEKGLNTYVKCNPTLLGYDFARKTVDDLGYDYLAFDDHHFKADLQKEDAFPMFRRLTALAESKGLAFGVKLSNTFPVSVAAGELPSEEMYMSGVALYPLTISLAAIISREFEGQLPISYSGGAEATNMAALFAAGIWPITVATTLLKPGGYQRLGQMAQLLADVNTSTQIVDYKAVAQLAEEARSGDSYRKPVKPLPNRHLDKKVPLTDCFTAPCRGGCPIGQDIPAYLMAVKAGKFEKALDIITQRNPLPFITGTICPHHCGDKCLRNYYDESVGIRGAKLAAANLGYEKILAKQVVATAQPDKKVAIVGGGPAGLAAAFFLARAGVAVTIFESKDSLGGIVRHVIPDFRIDGKVVDRDVALCLSLGVKVVLNKTVTKAQPLLSEGYSHVLFATGAWRAGDSPLSYGESWPVLSFLEQAKKFPDSLDLGTDVVVIGGGNTAMDAARAAKELPGVERVRLVYRRTKRYMPADEEELALALEDGVEFCELLAPVGEKDDLLTCEVMELGAPDSSGRRSPQSTGKTVTVPATTVITAVGEQVDDAPFVASHLDTDKKGRPVVSATMESSQPGIFVVGDARRGPSTVVEAIADAISASVAIAGWNPDAYVSENAKGDRAVLAERKGCLSTAPGENLCLGCATLCQACVDVCPNRANVAIHVPGKAMPQIIHVDGMCNECGNCGTFCPYDSRPYRDKFTLYWSREDFDNSTNEGWLPLGDGKALVRLDAQVETWDLTVAQSGLMEELRQLMVAVEKDYCYLMA